MAISCEGKMIIIKYVTSQRKDLLIQPLFIALVAQRFKRFKRMYFLQSNCNNCETEK